MQGVIENVALQVWQILQPGCIQFEKFRDTMLVLSLLCKILNLQDEKMHDVSSSEECNLSTDILRL